jgi:hypothetical protein
MSELERTFCIDQIQQKLEKLPTWQLNHFHAAITEAVNSTSKCRSCGAPIVWGKTPNGKSCPFDFSTGESHFRSCPQAAGWSKKNEQAK